MIDLFFLNSKLAQNLLPALPGIVSVQTRNFMFWRLACMEKTWGINEKSLNAKRKFVFVSNGRGSGMMEKIAFTSELLLESTLISSKPSILNYVGKRTNYFNSNPFSNSFTRMLGTSRNYEDCYFC